MRAPIRPVSARNGRCLVLGAVLIAPACFNDYDQFDVTGGTDGGAVSSTAGQTQVGATAGQAGGSAVAATSGLPPSIGAGNAAGNGASAGTMGGAGRGGAASVAGAAEGGDAGSMVGVAGAGAPAMAGGSVGAGGPGVAGGPGPGRAVAATGGSAGAGGPAADGGVPAAGAPAAVGGMAGAGTAGVAGAAAAAGAGAGGVCGSDSKLCGDSCVALDDPQTGCANASCEPCTIAGGSATCDAGSCAILEYDPGARDCNAAASDGCEHSLSTASHTHCGGCDNDCTVQGADTGFVCSNLLCRCTNAEQCAVGNVNPYECNAAGRCVCDGIECAPGETCVRDPPDTRCGCNGGGACALGTVCCHNPASCFDLQTDANNCGACNWACPTGSTCVAGQCQ